MLIILSPSKTQNFDDHLACSEYTQPQLLSDSKKLIKQLKTLSEKDVTKLMSISPKLSALNVSRYKSFKAPFTKKNARQALLAFRGDVYRGFTLDQYKKSDYSRAQKRIRILSGLYGVLRPLDLIQPYRLEMKTKLKTPKATDLYQFWDNKLTDVMNKELEQTGSKYLINLASNEYYRALRTKDINAKIITPIFKERKGSTLKVVALFAKRARGEMANFIVQKKINSPEELKDFRIDGYRFQRPLSTDSEWVFAR